MTDNSDKLCIDLCCGRKGFSRAFAEAGWEVVTVDIDPRFEPTVCADVLELDARGIADATKLAKTEEWWDGSAIAEQRPDGILRPVYRKVVVVASPPCQRFSLANRMFPKFGIRKALEIVGAVYELIAQLRPDFWVVENPSGRLRWFLGTPNLKIRLSDYGSPHMKPTDLWTNVIFPMIEKRSSYTPSWSSKKNGGKGSTGLLRIRDPSKRAEMPLGLSQAILTATAGEPQEAGAAT